MVSRGLIGGVPLASTDSTIGGVLHWFALAHKHHLMDVALAEHSYEGLLNTNTKGAGAQILMNCIKSSPIHWHKKLQWRKVATPCNNTVLHHRVTLISSTLLAGTTRPLHALVGTQWHITTCVWYHHSRQPTPHNVQ